MRKYLIALCVVGLFASFADTADAGCRRGRGLLRKVAAKVVHPFGGKGVKSAGGCKACK